MHVTRVTLQWASAAAGQQVGRTRWGLAVPVSGTGRAGHSEQGPACMVSKAAERGGATSRQAPARSRWRALAGVSVLTRWPGTGGSGPDAAGGGARSST